MSRYYEINGSLTLSRENFGALRNSQIGEWFEADEGEIEWFEDGDDVQVSFYGSFRDLGNVLSSEVSRLLREHPSMKGEWVEVCTDGMTGIWEYEIRDGVLLERSNDGGQFYPFGTRHEEVLTMDGVVEMDGYIRNDTTNGSVSTSVLEELRSLIGKRVRLVVHSISCRNETGFEGFDVVEP